MKIANIVNWKHEVETAMRETFDTVTTNISEMHTTTGFVITDPIEIYKGGKEFAVVQVMTDGELVVWNPEDGYHMEMFLDTADFKNKMSMLCYLTKRIMMMDKYNTMS